MSPDNLTNAGEERARHTPGPWLIDKQRGNEIAILGPAKGATHHGQRDLWEVASVDLFIGLESFETSEILANARLIAAAPDLLAALKSVRDFVESELAQRGIEDVDYPDKLRAGRALDQIDAAIRKAQPRPEKAASMGEVE